MILLKFGDLADLKRAQKAFIFYGIHFSRLANLMLLISDFQSIRVYGTVYDKIPYLVETEVPTSEDISRAVEYDPYRSL